MASKADPNMIKYFAENKKCFMCKHRFDEPWIKPAKNTSKKLNPNFNVHALIHMQQTHGIPENYVRDWIVQSVYGWKKTGQLGGKPIFKELISE